jgi:hypothetical protein
MSEQIMRENLLVLAQAYATAKGRQLSTVSNEIHGNYAFLEKFSRGEVSVTLTMYFRMVDHLRRVWPAGTPWPKTSPMPKLGKKVDKVPNVG